MPSPWLWSAAAHRYRNTRTGQFIGQTQMLALRDTYASAKAVMAQELAVRVATNDITLGQWQRQMRLDVKRSFIDQYVLGRGGRGTMTQADWGRTGAMIKNQYNFLDGFASAIAGGELSEDQIAARSKLYHNASTQAYERGSAIAHGAPPLPYYPGDGSTECHTNCRCHWDIQETPEGWACFWIIDPAAEHCVDCVARSESDAPRMVLRVE